MITLYCAYCQRHCPHSIARCCFTKNLYEKSDLLCNEPCDLKHLHTAPGTCMKGEVPWGGYISIASLQTWTRNSQGTGYSPSSQRPGCRLNCVCNITTMLKILCKTFSSQTVNWNDVKSIAYLGTHSASKLNIFKEHCKSQRVSLANFLLINNCYLSNIVIVRQCSTSTKSPALNLFLSVTHSPFSAAANRVVIYFRVPSAYWQIYEERFEVQV